MAAIVDSLKTLSASFTFWRSNVVGQHDLEQVSLPCVFLNGRDREYH